MHKVLHMINFEPFALESRCLYQNALQRLLSTNGHRICVNYQSVNQFIG